GRQADDLLDRRVHVDRLALERQLAAHDARRVEEVVDQARLDADVAADHLQRRREGGRDLPGALERRDREQDRRERGPQLVAERRDEAILRLALGARERALVLVLLALLPQPLALALGAPALGHVRDRHEQIAAGRG